MGTNGLNYLAGGGNGYSGDMSGPIPAAFPKGYNAFYLMKYEISQGQLTDFFNFLDPGMANTLFANYFAGWYNSYRLSISRTGLVILATRPTAPAIGYTDPCSRLI